MMELTERPRIRAYLVSELNFPTFSGNPMQWFTFWDSFEVAVHWNQSLKEVQKFNYLKTQITVDHSRAVAGFPLTNGNYPKAVNLLKKRFSQPSKLVNAHRQALLDLPNLTNHLVSLQRFYDTTGPHVKGLETLGKSHETYGHMLVPILKGKLPHQVRQNPARHLSKQEWSFSQLREAILNEMHILVVGIDTNSLPSPAVEASFLTQTQGNKETESSKVHLLQ